MPPQVRGHFVAAFSGVSQGGLEVGRGQTGSSVQLPAGASAALTQQVEHLATAVFTHSFVDALRPTIVVVLLAALSAGAVRREERVSEGQGQSVREGETMSVA